MKKRDSEFAPIKAAATPQLKKRVKGPSPVQMRLIDAIAEITQNPDEVERAFMARELIICTLPYRNPGDVPHWIRRTGNSALILQPSVDDETERSFGYPYGVIPRLILFWIATEIVRDKERREREGDRVVFLGKSLGEFMRAIGFKTDSGRDISRLKDQMERLFNCNIDLRGSKKVGTASGRAKRDLQVAQDAELWWSRNPEERELLPSWIKVGENLFAAILKSPVPVDMRMLKAFKNSPMALDLCALICFRSWAIWKNNLPAQTLVWTQLMEQLGTENSDLKGFKRSAKKVLKKMDGLYPGLTIAKAKGGFTIYATRPAVPEARKKALAHG